MPIIPFLVVFALLAVLATYSIGITTVWTWVGPNHNSINSVAQLVLGGAVVFTAWTFFDNYTLKQERLVLITDRAEFVPEIDDEWGQLTSFSQSEAAKCPEPRAYCDPAKGDCVPPKQYKVHERLFYNHKTWTKILNLPYFLNGCIANTHCDKSATLDFFCPSMIKLDILLTAHNKTYDTIIQRIRSSKGSSDNFKGFPSDPSLLQMADEETPRNLGEILQRRKSRPQFNDYQEAYRKYYDVISSIIRYCETQSSTGTPP